MPIPVITIAQMREWERAAWAAGQTEAIVIRRVGACVARRASQLTQPEDSILILAGKGNNGADGLASREHLSNRKVEVMEVADPAADLPKLEAMLALQPALIIDGLFGIGLNRPLSPEWVRFIERINDARATVLAVDVPSGLNADTGEPQGAAIRAAVTLTVGAAKIGMVQPSAWPYAGRLEIAEDVGLAPAPATGQLHFTSAADFKGFPPPRAAAAHKGSYGHLAIFAGSVDFHGAAVLAARGAQRAQPGLITLYTMEGAYFSVAGQLQSVMVVPWQPDTKLPGSPDGVLFGPGLANPNVPEQMKNLMRSVWRNAPVPVVVDASALDWLPIEGGVPRNATRVITPHPGEAARLLRTTPQHVQANRVDSLRTLSRRFGNTWTVLKGHQTLVGRSTDELYINPSGNPHLAQGGSGDVLGGYIAGLMVQPALQGDALKTLRYAVWQHGAAADRLQATRRNWIVEDLATELGR